MRIQAETIDERGQKHPAVTASLSDFEFFASEVGSELSISPSLPAPDQAHAHNGEVYYQNIICRGEGMQLVGITGMAEIPQEVERLVEYSTLRGYLLSDGHGIFPESRRPLVESHARYLEAQGLVSAGSTKHALFVHDPCDYGEVLRAVKASGRRLVPYFQSGVLYHHAAKAGVGVVGSGSEVAHEVVDRFNHKSVFRDHNSELASPFPVPRCAVRIDAGITPECVSSIREVERYADTLRSEGVLPDSAAKYFVQAASAAGGFGNFPIFQNGEGELLYRSKSGDSVRLRSALDLVHDFHLQGSDFEITPFLKRELTYGLGIVVSEHRVIVLGPVEQVLSASGDQFLGWRIDSSLTNGRYHNLDGVIMDALRFGSSLHDLGYRGFCNQDIFQGYGQKSDGVVVFASEANMRRTATTHTLGFALRHPELSKQIVRGALSIREDEYIEVAQEHLKSVDTSEKLAQFLTDRGIPLVSDEQPYGVLIVVPGADHGVTSTPAAWLCTLGRNDGERDETFKRVVEALGIQRGAVPSVPKDLGS